MIMVDTDLQMVKYCIFWKELAIQSRPKVRQTQNPNYPKYLHIYEYGSTYMNMVVAILRPSVGELPYLGSHSPRINYVCIISSIPFILLLFSNPFSCPLSRR